MADVNASLPNWSTTRASNGPSGSAIAGAGIDDNFRELQGVVRGWLATIGADITVASTMDLGAVEGSTHNTVGTGTVTSFGTVSAGIRKRLIIGGATTTITHNGTSLICPGSANLSLVVGDQIDAESLGGGNWRITNVLRASGQPGYPTLASGVTSSATGLVAATNANTAINQLEQLASPAFSWITVTGTDTLTGTANALFTGSVRTGEIFRFVAANTNTAAVTINVNATGTKDITKNGTTALAAGDLIAGNAYEIHYDGTRFQLINPGIPSITGLTASGAATVGGALAVTGTITGSSHVVIPNASKYLSKDNAGTLRDVAYIDASDITHLVGSAGGFKLETNNGSTTALQVSASGKINSGALVASAAEVAALATDVFVTPSAMQSFPALAFAYCRFDGTASSPTADPGAYRISSVTKNGTGDYTVTFTTSISSGLTAVVSPGRSDAATTAAPAGYAYVQNATTVRVITYNGSNGAATDFPGISLIVFGA